MSFFSRKNKAPTLKQVFAEFREVNVRIKSTRTVENYHRSISLLSEIVGHEPTTDDLTDANVASMLRALLAEGRAAPTANNYAKSIKALWRFAATRGYVQRVSYAQKLVEAEPDVCTWSMQQMAQIFEACELQCGYIGPVHSRDWWVTFHMICWDTAERTGAILSLEWDWIDLEEGRLAIPPEARKGGQKWGRYRLRPATVAQLDQIRHPLRVKVFEGLEVRNFYRHYYALLTCAGLPVGRRNGPQRIRRTVATLLKAMGGDATRLLQHTDPRVTERSYMDESRLPQITPAEVVPAVVWNHGQTEE